MSEEKNEVNKHVGWNQFQEELNQHGFQVNASTLALDIIERGVHVYSVDKVNVKYNKRAHASHPLVSPYRIQKLEGIIFRYCGWGAKGSTHLAEQIQQWRERHLQNAR